MVKRVVIRRNGETYLYPPKLPATSPVDKHCKTFGRTKMGQHIVPRFWITQYMYGRTYLNVNKDDRWFIIDMKEANIAEGTEKKGYRSKKEAKRIAEGYRDEFGAWATIPF